MPTYHPIIAGVKIKLNKFNESEYAEIENIYKIPEDYNHTPKVTYKISYFQLKII